MKERLIDAEVIGHSDDNAMTRLRLSWAPPVGNVPVREEVRVVSDAEAAYYLAAAATRPLSIGGLGVPAATTGYAQVGEPSPRRGSRGTWARVWDRFTNRKGKP